MKRRLRFREPSTEALAKFMAWCTHSKKVFAPSHVRRAKSHVLSCSTPPAASYGVAHRVSGVQGGSEVPRFRDAQGAVSRSGLKDVFASSDVPRSAHKLVSGSGGYYSSFVFFWVFWAGRGGWGDQTPVCSPGLVYLCGANIIRLPLEWPGKTGKCC